MKREMSRVLDGGELERFFEAARAEVTEISDDFMERVMADADSVLAARAPVSRAEPERGGRLRRFVSGLGGWPAVAGMATAMLAGVWVGFAAPEQVNTLSGGLLAAGEAATGTYELEDLLPRAGGYDVFFEEG